MTRENINVTGGTYSGVDVTILGGGNLNSTGATAIGPGIINLTNGVVTTNGGHGLQARAGGQIDAIGLKIDAFAGSANGVMSTGSQSIISIFDTEVRKEGDDGGALDAFNGGTIIGSNLKLSTVGGNNQTHVVLASGPGSLINIDNSTITSDTDDIAGFYAHDGGRAIGTGLYVHMTGSKGDAVSAAADAIPSHVILSDSTLLTGGDQGYGLAAWQGSTIEAFNVIVETLGDAALGIVSSNNGTTLTTTGGSVLTIGANSHGLTVQDGGHLTADGATVVVTGAGAAGLSMTNGSSANSNMMKVTGGSLSSEEGPLILSEGGIGTISLNGPIATRSGMVGGMQALAIVTNDGINSSDIALDFNGLGNVAGIFRVTGAGNVSNTSFNATNWLGDLDADVGNAANFVLSGSHWLGQATNAADIEIDGASTWRITGNSNLTGTLTNAGQV